MRASGGAIGTSRRPVFGVSVCPKERPSRMLCTSHIERNNLTMRHIVGRTRRLCLAFGKSLHAHRAAEALGFMTYNFVRQSAALGGQTPAMAAGGADHPWPLGEL